MKGNLTIYMSLFMVLFGTGAASAEFRDSDEAETAPPIVEAQAVVAPTVSSSLTTVFLGTPSISLQEAVNSTLGEMQTTKSTSSRWAPEIWLSTVSEPCAPTEPVNAKPSNSSSKDNGSETQMPSLGNLRTCYRTQIPQKQVPSQAVTPFVRLFFLSARSN